MTKLKNHGLGHGQYHIINRTYYLIWISNSKLIFHNLDSEVAIANVI